MFCEKCGTKIDEGMKFCTNCGTPVDVVVAGTAQAVSSEKTQTKPLCAKCGAQIKEGLKFCTKCGTPVGAVAASTAQAVTTKQPQTVLIVERSKFIAAQLRQILTSEGFEVVATATDGAQGMEKYKELYPNVNLVIMDITMPDGVFALEKMLEFDKNANVIIVINVLRFKIDEIRKYSLMGAKNYIVKPLDRKKVLECVVSVLKGNIWEEVYFK